MFPNIDIAENREYLKQEFPKNYKQILYEMEYYNLWGELPENATALDLIEYTGDGFIFIYSDPKRLQ